MNGEATETQGEVMAEEDRREIVNMDAYDYFMMLMESRIIQMA